MALYLGNQKVSLRSGQDPTFDYGFDSNGRLVFANKNATEINNFLNYDSTYSEILDLSNLNKMEKVAVNGTADRKMEGLKGLLVSPNAPFTGSSPQINASYTGLSKSALVSLFESVPYNVGYTKVGNPTITDGVASGFSSSDYLTTNKQLNCENTNIDITIKFTTPNIISKTLLLFAHGGDYVYIKDNRRIETQFFASGRNRWVSINNSIQTNTTYWFRLNTNYNNGLKLYLSTNGTSYNLEKESDFWWSGNAFIKYGAGTLTPFTGSIDLNETYIKVNGVPWFTGKPDMTKTCSIVSATGTADLTQEDKNIILNKGWSLTVQ